MTAVADQWPSTAIGQYARQWLNMVGPDVSNYVAAVDPGGAAKAFDSLPLDYYAPGIAYFYTRDRWGPQATSIFVQMGAPSGGGHAHQDGGTFQIWRNGQYVTKESTGYGTAFTGGDSEGTQAHNGLLLNGVGQATAYANDYPTVLRLQNATNFSYAA